MLEQTRGLPQSAALIVVACETLQDAAGVLMENAARNAAPDAGGGSCGPQFPPQMVLAQVSGYDSRDSRRWPCRTVAGGDVFMSEVFAIINERLPLHGLQLRPYASVRASRMFTPGSSARAVLPARGVEPPSPHERKGKNQIEFLDPEQMEKGSAPPDGRAGHYHRAR